ncbi:ABC transporter permease [Streptomyces sp. 8L]|uniref:ABC transporter permease n=1 Tax=Streptomyces sp. 8L TaxID=2877242 RepID=UPI001CD58074|nr:ABC transporter permease [Streptomyces sp. 8L]MCA1216982.1 ABC transporter permease [Streptomyces sp. 8L]
MARESDVPRPAGPGAAKTRPLGTAADTAPAPVRAEGAEGGSDSCPGTDAVRASLRRRWHVRDIPVRRWAGLALLALVVLLCACAPLLSTYDPQATGVAGELLPPGTPGHLLGTDQLGRDELARLLYGGRTSLIVGLAAASVATLVGTAVGLGWAYLGSASAHAVSTVVDALLSLPLLVVVLAFQAVVRPGVTGVVLAIGLTSWMRVARTTRAQTASLRIRPYLTAARGLGARRRDLLRHHLLPGVAPAVLAVSVFEVASAVLTESTLSFLGLGVPPSLPTWGNLLSRGQDNLLGGQWWLVALPAACIVVTVLAVNVVIAPRKATRPARARGTAL